SPYLILLARCPASLRSLGRDMPKAKASARANRKKRLSGAFLSGRSPSYVLRHRVADRLARSRARPTSNIKTCFPIALSETWRFPALTPARQNLIATTRSAMSCSRISSGSTATSSKSTNACRTRSWSVTLLGSSGSIVGILYSESRTCLCLRAILSLDQADHILPMFSVPVGCYGGLVFLLPFLMFRRPCVGGDWLTPERSHFLMFESTRTRARSSMIDIGA